MTKKDSTHLIIIIVIFASLFGLVYCGSLLSNAKDKNMHLSNENNKIINELENTEDELGQFQSRQKNTRLVYTMLKNSYFSSALSDSGSIFFAILLNDKTLCDDVKGSDNKLCNDVFDNKCADEYEYPNREICAKLNTMLERKVSFDELVSHCNNKDLIEDDLSQNHCF